MSKKTEPFLTSTLEIETIDKTVDPRQLRVKFQKLVASDNAFAAFKVLTHRKTHLALEEKEILFVFKFGKKILTNIALKNPEKNVQNCNALVNKIANYLVTLLGAISKVTFNATYISYNDRPTTFAKNVLGDRRLARINDITKNMLKPEALVFEYEKGGRKIAFGSVGSEKASSDAVFLRPLSKKNLSRDIVLDGYGDVRSSVEMIRLLEKEEI